MTMHVHIQVQLLALEHCWSISTGELFDHPPYSPNLALSNYHLFTYLKNWTRSQHFNNNEELMEGVKKRLSSQAADFSDTGIQKLIPRYAKCLNSSGDYAEESLKYPPIFGI
jgi:histone-lysine N-methyltransferase SETMAR